MRKEFLKITANFKGFEIQKNGLQGYFDSIQELIYSVIDETIFPSTDSFDVAARQFETLEKMMPIVSFTEATKTQPAFSVTAICSAYQTHGMGRFMGDLYSHWLVPGKQMVIVNMRSLNFYFTHYPKISFYLNSLISDTNDLGDLALINSNLKKVSEELKLNILAVQHIRRVVSIKPLTLDQKKTLIRENISSLLNKSSKNLNPCIYDLMSQLLYKASADEKMYQIKEQLSPLIQLRPTAFDRDIFPEVQRYVSELDDKFIVARDLKYINRVISYHYIFRKHLANLISENNTKRLLSVKILKSTINVDSEKIPILGIVVGVNLFSENEVFEDKHIFKAIASLIPDCVLVEDSVILEKAQKNRIVTVYLEVKKNDHHVFTHQELKILKKSLPLELKNRIESLMNPIFMHRNDEEVMRNILSLSKQLKFIHDLPQVMVSFHKQTNYEVSFLVIILRVIKPGEETLKSIFNSNLTMLKFYDHEIKSVGQLRKRYTKEANVFEARLDKKQFLRKDFSLDLYKARHTVISEITRLIGDVRDYNGGMIAKQHEVLSELKELLSADNIRNDFLLENFFYSLTPNYMQSLLSPSVLKVLFMNLLKVSNHNFEKGRFYIKSKIIDDFFLMALGSLDPLFQTFIQKTLDELLTSCHDFTHSLVNVYDITCVGFLLRFEHPEEHSLFESHILTAIQRWEENTQESNLADLPLEIL